MPKFCRISIILGWFLVEISVIIVTKVTIVHLPAILPINVYKRFPQCQKIAIQYPRISETFYKLAVSFSNFHFNTTSEGFSFSSNKNSNPWINLIWTPNFGNLGYLFLVAAFTKMWKCATLTMTLFIFSWDAWAPLELVHSSKCLGNFSRRTSRFS